MRTVKNIIEDNKIANYYNTEDPGIRTLSFYVPLSSLDFQSFVCSNDILNNFSLSLDLVSVFYQLRNYTTFWNKCSHKQNIHSNVYKSFLYDYDCLFMRYKCFLLEFRNKLLAGAWSFLILAIISSQGCIFFKQVHFSNLTPPGSIVLSNYSFLVLLTLSVVLNWLIVNQRNKAKKIIAFIEKDRFKSILISNAGLINEN